MFSVLSGDMLQACRVLTMYTIELCILTIYLDYVYYLYYITIYTRTDYVY
jgi:hypothetical protein